MTIYNINNIYTDYTGSTLCIYPKTPNYAFIDYTTNQSTATTDNSTFTIDDLNNLKQKLNPTCDPTNSEIWNKTPVFRYEVITYDIATTPNFDALHYYNNSVNVACKPYEISGYYVYYEAPNDTTSKKFKLKNNLNIVIKSRAKEINVKSNAEIVAMRTLREMISESEYRRYLKYGFILVRGDESGDIYQITRGQCHTKVWRKGLLIEEICVRIKDSSLPPTDAVIAFMHMIQASEEEFKAIGNRYNMAKAA